MIRKRTSTSQSKELGTTIDFKGEMIVYLCGSGGSILS